MPRGETRVFLGNLPPDVRVRDIEDFFSKCGRVRNVLIKHGKYGFAEFEDSRDAEDAVYDMHGKRFMGARITVELAKGPRGGKEARRAPWVAKYGAPQRTKYKLRVENLSSRISWQDLKDTLRKAGEVTFAEAHVDRRNEGRVELASMEDLERVYKRYQGYEMNGRKIALIKDVEKSKSKSRDRDSRSMSRRDRSGSHQSTARFKKSKSGSKRSNSRSKKSGSKSDRSYSRDKSGSLSPAKKVDPEDKDVRRLRKRSPSRESQRSETKNRNRSSSKDNDRSPSRRSKSSAKKIDPEDKDVRRLRKRSHSRESKNSGSKRSNRSSSQDNDRSPSRGSRTSAKKARRSDSKERISISRPQDTSMTVNELEENENDNSYHDDREKSD